MTYLHCHQCGWQQDDYWSETYNPLRGLLDWEETLLHRDLEETIPDHEAQEQGQAESVITWREAIARDVEKAAQRIRAMKYRTMIDARQEAGWTCPHCHTRALDED